MSRNKTVRNCHHCRKVTLCEQLTPAATNFRYLGILLKMKLVGLYAFRCLKCTAVHVEIVETRPRKTYSNGIARPILKGGA